jgi:hypothetical protein
MNSEEISTLHRIAGIMIPPDETLGVPGADDPIIFADISRSLGRDLPDVRAALSELANADEQTVQTFLARGDHLAAVLGRVVLQCYYRDDRVLLSLGVEPRPPFPQGHTLEQGDWSLLDVVRHRPKLWRDDRETQR